jgi:hypothetical membrane protein
MTPTKSRTLALVATAGPPLFMLVGLLAALAKPHYDIVQQSVSELAVGPYGWIQTANFLVLGAAIGAYAIARRSVLFGVAALGVLLSAVYETDLPGAAVTSHGSVHNLLFVVAFLSLVVAIARRGGRPVALGTFALMVVFALFTGDVGDPLHSAAGLIERVMIGVPLAWIAVSAAQELDAVAPRIRRVEAADAR